MSHLVTIHPQVHDPVAVAAACTRLQLPAPVQGTAQLYSGPVTGLLVHLPGWRYPAVIDTLTGALHYDNYEGRWGKPEQLHRFLQAYAVEKAKSLARQQGMLVHEQQLQDGSIKLQLRESASDDDSPQTADPPSCFSTTATSGRTAGTRTC